MATTLIRLPAERAHQLRMLANAKQATMVDVITDLVTREINRLGLSSEIGLGTFDVAGLEDGTVTVSHRDLGNYDWPANVAVAVADALDNHAGPAGGASYNVDANLQFQSVGTGVRLTDALNGGSTVIAKSVARDLAALIRSEATATV